VGRGRTRRRRPCGWAVVVAVAGPGTTGLAAVPAGTVRGSKERWVEMRVVASLRGRRVCGQCW